MHMNMYYLEITEDNYQRNLYLSELRMNNLNVKVFVNKLKTVAFKRKEFLRCKTAFDNKPSKKGQQEMFGKQKANTKMESFRDILIK
jgi:hypothetical protein